MKFTWEKRHSMIILFICVPLFHSAQSEQVQSSKKKPLYCYQCHSKFDADCKEMQVNASQYYKPCIIANDAEPFCRKIVQRIHITKVQVTLRKCGWIRHPTKDCYRVRNLDHAEYVCQCFTDGCNSAGSIQPILGLLLLPLLLVLLPTNVKKLY